MHRAAIAGRFDASTMKAFATRWWGGVAGLGLAAAVMALVLVLVPREPDVAAMRAAATAEVPAAQRAQPFNMRREVHFEPQRAVDDRAARGERGVLYVWRGAAQQVRLFDDGMALSARRSSVAGATEFSSAQLRFVGARLGGSFAEREPVAARSHYLRGRDDTRWLGQVPHYRQLRYAELYPGIDLVYYGRDGDFEFDFVVKPGADPSRIRLQSRGTTPPLIDAKGDLLLDGAGGVLRVHRPVLHQDIDGRRVNLDARWVLRANGALSFELPAYDKRYTLVIDPVFKLLYSSYLGGVHDDLVGAMTMDAQGNAYVIGNSGSEDWPVSGNAVQTRRKNLGSYVRNVVVTKFDAAGGLIWSTFLGGSVNDYGNAIALDAAGNVVIGGYTNSSDFPTTAGAYQTVLRGGTSAFIAALSPDGSTLLRSTLYGGDGTAVVQGLVLDAAGNVVVTGTAGTGLPTTAGVYKATLATGHAAFVARFSPPAAGPLQLLAATYYGSDTPENSGGFTGNTGAALALDAAGGAWITGQSYTTKLPSSANALQAPPTALDQGCVVNVLPLHSFGYLAHFSADLKTLQFASYLTGYNRAFGLQACDEYTLALQIDAAGDVYVHGATASDKFPTTPGTSQASYPGHGFFTSYAAFVTKIKGDASRILWSTYLGGSDGNTFAGKAVIDAASGTLWVPTLTTGGANFPLSADAMQKTHGGGTFDGALTQLDMATGTLRYSSYLGGSADDIAVAVGIDGGGNVFVAGNTNSRNFAVTSNAYQPTYTVNAFDGSDWFLRVLGSGAISQVRPSSGGNSGSLRVSVNGVGFQSGAQVELVGASTLTASGVLMAPDGTQLSAQFDLRGVAPGSFKLRVRNPDGTEVSRNAAFTVQSGGEPKVWANVVGRPAVRIGVPASFVVNYGNSGGIDAYLTSLTIRFPSTLDFSFPDGLFAPGDVTHEEDVSPQSWLQSADGYTYVTILVTSLPAGETRSINLQLTKLEAGPFRVDAYMNKPYENNASALLAELDTVLANPTVSTALCKPVDAAKPGVRNCLGMMLTMQTDSAYNRVVGLRAKGAISEADWRRDLQTRFATDLRNALLTVTGKLPLSSLASARLQRLSTDEQGTRRRSLDFGDFIKTIWEENPLTGWMGKSVDAAVKKNGTGDPVIKLPPGAKITYTVTQACKCPPKPATAKVRLGYYPGNDKHNAFVPISDEFFVACRKGKPVAPVAQAGVRALDAGATAADASVAPQTASPSLASLLGLKKPLAGGDSCPNPPDDDKCHCDEEEPKPEDSGGSCSGGGGSIDPNDKSGPNGDGSAGHFLSTAPRLSYVVAFENQAVATLPAAQVVVTDPLDVSKFDLSTLALGSISWGPYRIDVPAGQSSFATVFPINVSISVRVQGSLNPGTGVLKWTFTTIDPVTKLPPSDPTLGFLPPNKNGTEGQGYVTFSIAPKAGLPDGTRWVNAASIVFDTNAAIGTPTWVNTLDTTAPSSRVAAAAQKASSADVDVSWAGSDAGSGVASYTVRVSDNGGAFSDWQSAVSATAAVYPGVAGHSYGFTVVAIDRAGNVEASRLTSDMTVAVKDPAAPPVQPSSGGGGGCTIAGSDQRDASLVLMLAAAVTLCWRRASSRPKRSRHTRPD